MTTAGALHCARIAAESAVPLKLKNLVGALVILARVPDVDPFVARAAVATAPVANCDLGIVVVRFSRLQDALSMAGSGWVMFRVASGGRPVGPLSQDAALARHRIAELAWDVGEQRPEARAT